MLPPLSLDPAVAVATDAYRTLVELCAVPGRERGEAIAALLPDAVRHPFRGPRRRAALNLVAGDPAPRVIIGAHHDIDPRTVEGATDNTAAVAVLIAIARTLLRDGFPDGLALCFWDLEEPANGGFSDGAEAYARQLRAQGSSPDLAVVVDVVGLGVPWLSRRSHRLTAAAVRRGMAPAGYEALEVSTPGSDDVGLARLGIRSALLTTLPEDGDTHGWHAMHSPDDCLDLVDPFSLSHTERALRTLISSALDTPDGLDALLAGAEADERARRELDDARWQEEREARARRRIAQRLDRTPIPLDLPDPNQLTLL